MVRGFSSSVIQIGGNEEVTCSHLIDTRHYYNTYGRLNYERLLLAHNRPSVPKDMST